MSFNGANVRGLQQMDSTAFTVQVLNKRADRREVK